MMMMMMMMMMLGSAILEARVGEGETIDERWSRLKVRTTGYELTLVAGSWSEGVAKGV